MKIANHCTITVSQRNVHLMPGSLNLAFESLEAAPGGHMETGQPAKYP